MMAEKAYIEREAAKSYACDRCGSQGHCNRPELCPVMSGFDRIPAADVRPVVVCANCEYNNACLTQAFVEDCGKIPLDRNTFFCADGERAGNA